MVGGDGEEKLACNRKWFRLDLGNAGIMLCALIIENFRNLLFLNIRSIQIL